MARLKQTRQLYREFGKDKTAASPRATTLGTLQHTELFGVLVWGVVARLDLLRLGLVMRGLDGPLLAAAARR